VSRRAEDAKDERITTLEAKLAKKREVVAALMERHVPSTNPGEL
jgi:hypothetical protein